MNEQYVLVEYHDSTVVFRVLSSNELDMEKVVEYLTLIEGFNQVTDSVTFIDVPDIII
jgi:hypothetical protein